MPSPSKAPNAVNKYALAFILAAASPISPKMQESAAVSVIKRKRASSNTCSTSRKAPRSDDSTSSQQGAHTTINASTAMPKKNSKLCVVDGCTSRSKHKKLCWRHGGSIKCKIGDCTNRAKSKGVCWSHGGGTLCSLDKCDTVSVSNGFCWAHGGGKRCAVHQCSKPAYERTQNYCTAHYKEIHTALYGGGRISVVRV